jgi:hypothetical protein
MNLIMVLVPPHFYNTKRYFYGRKHHLEVDKMHLYSVFVASLPNPLSAMERSDSWKPYAERGKEIE